VHIPTPGINGDALASFFAQAKGTLFQPHRHVFRGRPLRDSPVFALGIMPYISASSSSSSFLRWVIPYLERLQKEGEMGRKKIVAVYPLPARSFSAWSKGSGSRSGWKI